MKVDYQAFRSQFGSSRPYSSASHSPNDNRHLISSAKLTLHKRPQNLTPRLQQRMSHDNLQEALQAFPPMLNHIVREPIREHLPWERGNRDARGLALEDVTEIFEVGVSAADDGVAQFEGGDVGARVDLVGGVHAAGGGAVGLGVFDLVVVEVLVGRGRLELRRGREGRMMSEERRTSISRKFSGGP